MISLEDFVVACLTQNPGVSEELVAVPPRLGVHHEQIADNLLGFVRYLVPVGGREAVPPVLYLFKEQTYRGRCVVAYRAHVNELFELPPTELMLFAQDVARAAKAMKAAFNPAKINYGAYSDKLPHLHMHLVPKYVDGPNWGAPFVMMPEPKQILSAADYTDLIARLRPHLA